MSSFAKMSVWPVGYFRAFSSWLLRNRRDVARNIQMLNAEIERIGFIRVQYAEGGQGKHTEQRVGFLVSPDSILEKLVRAYVVQGGNPFDISPMWHPDETAVVSVDGDGNPTLAHGYPHGGVVAPRSAEYNNPAHSSKVVTQPDGTPVPATGYGDYEGGYLETVRYYPARIGTRWHPEDLDVAKLMRAIRDWANQAIRERLLEIEARIIKQMDLREQLIIERDQVLTQAFGGVLTGLGYFDPEQFNPSLRVQNLVSDMYEMLFQTEGGEVTAFQANNDVGFMNFTFSDDASEIRDPLGG